MVPAAGIEPATFGLENNQWCCGLKASSHQRGNCDFPSIPGSLVVEDALARFIK